MINLNKGKALLHLDWDILNPSSYNAGAIVSNTYKIYKGINDLITTLFEEFSEECNRIKSYIKSGGFSVDYSYREDIISTIRQLKILRDKVVKEINNIKSYSPWAYDKSFKKFLENASKILNINLKENLDTKVLDNINYWFNPKDGTWNPTILVDGKKARLRAGIIIVRNGNEILLGEEEQEPGVFSLPGGAIDKGEDEVSTAIREAQEEVHIKVKNAKYTGIDYCVKHKDALPWVKENIPEKEWWYHYYTKLVIADYDGKYTGSIADEDEDISLLSTSKFYKFEDVLDEPSFKPEWKKALIKFGYLNKKNLKEDITEEYNNINQELEQYIKDNYKINPLTQRGVILRDGTVIENPLDEENYHISHGQLMQKILGNSKLKIAVPQFNFYDEIWENYGIIRINKDYEHTLLLTKQRPTIQQYKALEKWLDYYINDEDNYLYLSGKHSTIGLTFKTEKYGKILVTSSEEIINMIKQYYRAGTFLTEELNENYNNTELEELIIKYLNEYKPKTILTNINNCKGPFYITPLGTLIENFNYKDEYQLLQDIFEGYYKIVDYPPLGSSYILEDGKFLELGDATHGVFEQDCYEQNVNFEFINNSLQANTATNPYDNISGETYPYVTLIKNITNRQINSLRDWLDLIVENGSKNVEINFKIYSLINNTTDELIKKIRRYRATGILVEELNDEIDYLGDKTKDEILNHLKDKFKKTSSYYRANTVLDDGTIIALSYKESKKYGYGHAEHADVIKYLTDRGIEDTNAPNTNISKFLWDNANAMRIYGYKGVELPKHEPTSKQYNYILKMIRDNINNYEEIEIGTPKGDYAAYDLKYHSPNYIIGRIKRYYNTGVLVEEMNIKIPKYLYHATTSDKIRSIKALGLGADISKKMWVGGVDKYEKKTHGVFLDPNPYNAYSFVEISDEYDEDEQSIVVFVVDTDDLDKSKLSYDENNRVDIEEYRSFFYDGVIPYKYLKIELEENLLKYNKKDKNTFIYKNKKYWSGSVSLLDGIIEEVHTYQKAEKAAFHHSYYFSKSQIEKMELGENAFFFVDDRGIIYINPMDRGIISNKDLEDIKNKVKQQIKIINKNGLLENIEIYRGDERAKLTRFEGDNVNEFTDTGEFGIFFGTTPESILSYGYPQKWLLDSKANLYWGYSSEEFCKENNLMDEYDKKLYEISDGYTLNRIEKLFKSNLLDDMNSIFGAYQYMAYKYLHKKYDGAYWEFEDDLTGEQYQIWNPKVIKYIG